MYCIQLVSHIYLTLNRTIIEFKKRMNFFSNRNFSFSCKAIVLITHGRVLQD